ncbi:hypothetical protein L13192_03833 [Pyrenophora tritici-repentis]|uniref:DUF8035 domain-containing protein n=1 Tax=Pyrenophora tritici-repentis (strain Pt-1C-BFP) TaxID=426418 RepID=B2WMX7_PYRTR|nr:uncharacterized protein PTRG_11337 [Pyrenophora tritici-repentis Pt-1C-BFP]EDU44387.1 hypothetical protein PTRG_11337 [Pyrenophora tritici-repentis Pt-1C-BFP]KAI1672974.1 hypothetical protein L13192_03833 [Pyrenophora tritici-repentis]KAI1677213.1 hypothetical protein KJE20_13302 [Pyrenophora tritici-repentis]
MSAYRSSTGNLGRFEEPPRGGGGGGERWDRDRFERMRRGGGGGGGGSGGGSVVSGHGRGRDDYEHFRFQEHDRFPGGHRDVDIHEDRSRRGPPVMERERERERFHEDERFGQPPRRAPTELFHEPSSSEIANQALAPYRRRSVIDKDIDIDIDINERRRTPRPPKPARPQYIRRQSSLDTFDRRPMPRYGDVERIERYETHEYRPPANVPIPLPIRERRRSPRHHFDEEDDFEEITYDDRGGRRREREDYREVEVHREKSRVRRSKSVAAKSTRSSSMSSFEEIQPSRATWGKKGKTRLPKRLVKKQAVIDLGYPFEEEDDFIIVTRALEKEHIDEVIKVSENYKEEKITYVYEEKVEDAPPRPPSVHSAAPPPPQEYYPPPPPSVMHAPPPPPPMQYAQPPPTVVYAQPPPSHHAPTVYAHSERAPSPSVHEHERYVEIDRSAAIHGPATSFLPEHRSLVIRKDDRRSERDIREEIRSLEEERRMLKYEREGDREYEFIERAPKKEIMRVDRDRKGRLALVRSAH